MANYNQNTAVIIGVIVAIVVIIAVILIVVFVPCGKSGFALPTTSNPGELPTVSTVDLARYQGTWYEIARIPNAFEVICKRNAKAVYSLGAAPQELHVVNSCQGDTQTYSINGVARPAAGTRFNAPSIVSPGKLEISFQNIPIAALSSFGQALGSVPSAPYWIFYLDDSYTNAMVGSPDKSTLWFLSKNKTMDPVLYNDLIAKAQNLGFDTSRIQKTEQN